jgi:uncharacterized protein (DUF488 family)
MITRQRALLRLIALEGGKVSKLRLVKLAFLLRQTAMSAPSSAVYDFLPYQYGPYSFTLNHELRVLEREGWLRVTDTEIVAARTLQTETMKLEKSLAYQIDSLVAGYRTFSTDALVNDVYRRFPWYTAHARNVRRRAATIPTATLGVYTVGYEGLMLDGVLDLLLRNGIKQLVDVRCNPIARRFGFHKSTLDRHCNDVGVSYVHVPELGIPSSWRQELDDETSYAKLFRRYEMEILPANERWIEVACRLAREKPTAFMCMEANAEYCHRTRLARVVSERTALPLQELRCQ